MEKEIKELIAIYSKGLNKEAFIKANILLKKYPNTPFILNIMGMINIDLGEYKKAIDFFSNAIKFDINFSEAHNNMGTALHYLGKFKEAISSFKYAVKFKPEYFSAYNNLGISFKEIGDWEKAIKCYVKAIEIKPNYNEAHNNLIRVLTFYTPRGDIINSCVKANKILQSKKFTFDSSKKIDDNEVINFYTDVNKIIKSNLNKIDYNLSQIYRRNKIDLNCKRHFKVFNKFNVIPEYCFSCYKVQVEPRSVMELFKLYFIFDNLNLEKNNTRKCLIEMREGIKGSYKGLIYCFSLDEANQIIKKLSKLVSDHLDNNISITVKRGCSEFAISYPDYKDIIPEGDQKFQYQKEWKHKEDIIDEKIKIIDTSQKIVKDSLNGITVNDVLIMRNWLMYAKKIGDLSYKKIDQDFLIADYIENQLSSQIIKRREEFHSN